MTFDIANIDWDEFLTGAQAYAGDEGRALAENIGRNLTESVRQSRNALEAAINARKTKAEVADATSLEMSAQTERNAEASFTTHLKAIQRGVANELGQKLRAREFMAIKFEGPIRQGDVEPQPAPILSLDEYAAANHANLGPHPHSNLLAVPLPPGYEDVQPFAAKLVKLPLKERNAALTEMLKQKAQLPPPPPPAPPVATAGADGEGEAWKKDFALVSEDAGFKKSLKAFDAAEEKLETGALNREEAAVVYHYTTDKEAIRSLNEQLWGGKLSPHNQALTNLLDAAEAKLPAEERIVYRKVPVAEVNLDEYAATYAKGKIVEWPAFTSTTKDIKHAHERAGNVLFKIFSTSGRDISGMSSKPHEYEVLLKRPTQVLIREYKRWHNQVIILVEEL